MKANRERFAGGWLRCLARAVRPVVERRYFFWIRRVSLSRARFGYWGALVSPPIGALLLGFSLVWGSGLQGPGPQLVWVGAGEEGDDV